MPLDTGALDVAPEGQSLAALGQTSRWDTIKATAASAFDDWPSVQLGRLNESAVARGDISPADIVMAPEGVVPSGYGSAEKAEIPDVPMEQAKKRVSDAGLKLNLGDAASIKQPALDLMIHNAQAENERNDVIARGPTGFVQGALDAGTSLFVGAADPLNTAASFVPIMGEARYSQLMAAAGKNVFSRAAVRAGVGAAQGAAFTAAFEPLRAAADLSQGKDFTFANVLHDMIYGAGQFALLHTFGGAFSDVLRAYKGHSLYPFAPGELKARPEILAPENALVRPGTEPAESSARAAEEIPGAQPLGREPSAEARPVAAAAAAGPGGETAPQAARQAEGQTGALPAAGETPAQLAGEAEAARALAFLNDLPPRVGEDMVRAGAAKLINGETFEADAMLVAGALKDERIAKAIIENAEPEAVLTPSRKGPSARDPQTYSLLEFLAAHGGIRSDDNLIEDLRGSIGRKNKFVPGFGQLIRDARQLSTAAKLGGRHEPMSLDRAREASVEAGYLHDAAADGGHASESTINSLLEAIDQELRGKKVYRYGYEQGTPEDAGKRLHQMDRALDTALEEMGVNPETVAGPLRDRVLEIMDKEGVYDPLSAWERAVMEATHYGAEQGRNEPVGLGEPIPGWDVSDDAGSAQAAGGEPASIGTSGHGRAARIVGAGDGGARAQAAQLAADAWREIAQAKPPEHDPENVDAYKEAQGVKPPPQEPKERAAKALAEAARVEQEWAQVEQYLSPEEREKFAQAIHGLDQDHADREEIIRQGTACLMAAIG